MWLEISIISDSEQINMSCLIEAMDCAGSTKLNGKCRIDRPRKASNNKKVPHKVKDLNPSEMNEVLNDANLSINCYSHSFTKLRNRDHAPQT